jgi:hypothetical protein
MKHGPPKCGNLNLNQYTTPGLFKSTGEILPSASPQTFTADSSDTGFKKIASIISSSSKPSEPQLFYCDEATTVSCIYGDLGGGNWGGVPPIEPGPFEFPNATLTSIQVTISPFNWVQNQSGGWSMEQPDGSLATISVAAYGNPGFGLPPVVSAVPAPATLPLFATGLSLLAWLAWRRQTNVWEQ